MKNKKSKAGFTLAELLVSLMVGTVVLGVTASLLVQIYWSWRDGIAMWYLSQEARVARERMLRGIGGQYGMREGSFETVSIQAGASAQVERLDFDDEGVKCRIQTNPGLGASDRALATGSGSGSGTPTSILNSLVTDDYLQFTLYSSSRILRTDLTLSLQMGGKTYVHRQQINTYMLND